MNIDLVDTTTGRIQDSLRQARHLMGGPAVGMVLTLIIVTDEAAQYDAARAATEAAREHPCRVIIVIARDSRASASRLDAEIQVGETGPGETVKLRMYGPVADHADTVVLPLLVPDTPVVTWWPGTAPQMPGNDPLGSLAQRRVTDAYAADDRLSTLARLGKVYKPGDTDFTWTRLTNWRSLLAASLDQDHDEIVAGQVEAEPDSPSAELLAAWLSVRLGVPIERRDGDGPGIIAVRLATASGDIAVTRPDGRVATLSRPDQPDRQVALHRRATAELLAEELRRLDPDEVYFETVSRFAKEHQHDKATAHLDDRPRKAGPAAAAAPSDAVPSDAVPSDAVPSDAGPAEAVPSGAAATEAPAAPAPAGGRPGGRDRKKAEGE